MSRVKLLLEFMVLRLALPSAVIPHPSVPPLIMAHVTLVLEPRAWVPVLLHTKQKSITILLQVNLSPVIKAGQELTLAQSVLLLGKVRPLRSEIPSVRPGQLVLLPPERMTQSLAMTIITDETLGLELPL